jgi:glutaredoxin
MMPRALTLLLSAASALVPATHTRKQATRLDATLTVYSTLGCPHCQRAKKALDAAGLAYDVVDVADAAAREALEARSGLPTVPQVYLDEERVGGADDTLAALADGWLLEQDVERAAPKRVETAETVAVFIDAPPGGPLNAPVDGRAVAPMDGDVAALLQRSALELIDAHVTLDGRVDYAALKTSMKFQNFLDLARQLPDIDGASVGDAFWINLYNAMVLHATVVLGPPKDEPAARTAFFSGDSDATYAVAGHVLSLDDVEHALLRRSPAGDARSFSVNDPRRQTFAPALARKFDSRIHFALNCGASSCPPVKLFRDESLDGDLAAAARAFVGSEVSVSGRTVTASKLFLWYGGDFGEDVVRSIATLGGGTPSGDAVARLLEDGGDAELVFADYDWSPNDASSSV